MAILTFILICLAVALAATVGWALWVWIVDGTKDESEEAKHKAAMDILRGDDGDHPPF